MALAVAQLADALVRGRIASLDDRQTAWPYPGRKRMFFCAERHVHEGSLCALMLPELPARVRREAQRLKDLWNATTMPVAEFDARCGRTSVPVVVPAHGSIGVAFRGRAEVHATSSRAAEVVYGDHGALIARDDTDRRRRDLAGGPHAALARPARAAPTGRRSRSCTARSGRACTRRACPCPRPGWARAAMFELDLGDFVGAVRFAGKRRARDAATTPGAVVPVTGLLRPGPEHDRRPARHDAAQPQRPAARVRRSRVPDGPRPARRPVPADAGQPGAERPPGSGAPDPGGDRRGALAGWSAAVARPRSRAPTGARPSC